MKNCMLFRWVSVGALLCCLTLPCDKVEAGQSLQAKATVRSISNSGSSGSVVFNVNVDEKERCKIHNGQINFKTIVQSSEGTKLVREGYQTWNNMSEKQFMVQWTGSHLPTEELTDVTDVVTESVCLD